MRSGVFRFVAAQAVLLATGGGPTMYRYHTPSGDKSMDGLAMALRFGLPLRDMEMVQFHLGPANIAREFKDMVERCRDCGFDLAGGLVEVVQTAQYSMGV